jgi:hypothetical protein
MSWALIVPPVLLIAGCVAVLIFSRRQNYRLLLKNTAESVESITDLTRRHIDVYERLYGLIFFFANDLSAEKQNFALGEGSDMQELFDLNILVDLEISILMEKATSSEKLVAERSVSLKNITEELEDYEKNYAPAIMLFNQRVGEVQKKTRSTLSRKILSGIGVCTHSPIVFPN